MKIPCSIIRELLPNYVDECITGEASHLVEEHLKECATCTALYEDMKKPIKDINDIEIDYLKKVRLKNYHRIILILVMAVVIWFGGIFIVKSIYNNNLTNTSVVVDEVSVKGGRIKFIAHLAERDGELDQVVISSGMNGRQSILFKTKKVEPNTGGRAKKFEISLRDIESYIEIGDKVIDKKGNVYDQAVFDLVDHGIIMNNVAENADKEISKESLSLLHDQFMLLLHYAHIDQYADKNGYTANISMEQQPYTLDVVFHQRLDENQLSAIEKKAKAVLAVIENCNIMNIKYQNGESEEVLLQVNYTIKTKNYEEMQSLWNGN